MAFQLPSGPAHEVLLAMLEQAIAEQEACNNPPTGELTREEINAHYLRVTLGITLSLLILQAFMVIKWPKELETDINSRVGAILEKAKLGDQDAIARRRRQITAAEADLELLRTKLGFLDFVTVLQRGCKTS